ncbi:hypothetical protein HD806DRAFT_375779 [Xylariaceae sp. AK1471]|nr:hypothetical protein HD806DRAFT_375779 [Xylariaceae sp. AK1471]
MSHRRSHHHSRPSRTDAQESRRARRRRKCIEEGEDGFPLAEEEPSFALDDTLDQNSPWQSTSGAEGALAVPRSFDVDSSTHASRLSWTYHGTGGADTTFDNNPHYHHLPLQLDSMPAACTSFREPVWQRSPTTYQPSSHDRLQASMSPATSSQVDGSSTAFRGTGYSQPGSTPSPSYQASQDWAASASQDQTSEVDHDSDRMLRRWSIQARQGSAVGLSGVGNYDNAVVHVSMNQHPTIEEHNSSDSNGVDTTQEARDQYVRVCMSGDDAPWSPEFPHQAHGRRYPG